ncbi:hypothetical protein CAG57_08635 [Vibrio sp. V30_P3S12P165]|nr:MULTISPECIES: hypothetical protein [unclassified Vibrio]NAW69410.1 hypothetical protein [Vibrio sp. V28_P6S34P95]NAX05238.1 hypothetical protein [Vibrio sp. V30_P3S12P165]
MNVKKNMNSSVEGHFVDLHGERYYKISHVDKIDPFFISIVSSSNHWFFISSTGSLSAGRIRPENALFPYKSVDHIHESAENTGSKTIIRVKNQQEWLLWEPFNRFHDGLYQVERHLYKNNLGDKIVFEELNHTLKLKFQYSWTTCEKYGFIRRAEITDLSGKPRTLDILDGLQNILPSGAPLAALQTRSALVDAYKWNEQVVDTSLALYTMYAKLSDRAEPAESLLATTVFSLDDELEQILLSSEKISVFRCGERLVNQPISRGVRGSYLINKTVKLLENQSKNWLIVADIDKNHCDVRELEQELATPAKLAQKIETNIMENQQELIFLMSGGDAWQVTEQEATYVHHYANVLFNSMRGGVIENNYQLDKKDVFKTMMQTNRSVVTRQRLFFDELPDGFTHAELVKLAKQTGDTQLVRLSYEYLPLTFGRRHGDPSRPWNHYEIKLKDDNGERLLSYQGNWRDIFQNWEALALSYPGFISSFMAKFVNASTMDGYNPYRITKDGIDWELLEADDPWSNIGYWGDHQIIYLLKFLELSKKYQPEELKELLTSDLFSYANVPYELCSVDGLFANPKDTVTFNYELQKRIEEKIAQIGSDGRLVLTGSGQVYMVNLCEKILVPLLSKLSNLVLDGGIWLNTQRPEWNDANNAIVGNGLSMVTLYYMRRYVVFMQGMVNVLPSSISISKEVFDWMLSITRILQDANKEIRQGTVNRQTRKAILTLLEKSADEFRQRVYRMNSFSGKTKAEKSTIEKLLEVSLVVLDSSIKSNLREDGLYNAYNILTYSGESLSIENLYPMLEGQVAVLSAGVLTPKQAVELLNNLFNSDMYREDQQSFMLYPDRELINFVERNRIESDQIKASPVIVAMLANNDHRIVLRDLQGDGHFHAKFENVNSLRKAINQVQADYPELPKEQWDELETLYEQVFNHRTFTGRSGTMFGYEGLGCIYWHMVSKLLLAVQENYQYSFNQDPDSIETKLLAQYYYRVRHGIGFNKTPQNYGAFPTDPYSHTPKHAGAQQPGMTGQVKEEILTRFGELGLQVKSQGLKIIPSLLKRDEFLSESATFNFLNVNKVHVSYVLKANQLAFTYCQVPFIYEVSSTEHAKIFVHMMDGKIENYQGTQLPKSRSQSLFERRGEIEKIIVYLPEKLLYKDVE